MSDMPREIFVDKYNILWSVQEYHAEGEERGIISYTRSDIVAEQQSAVDELTKQLRQAFIKLRYSDLSINQIISNCIGKVSE